MFYSSRAEKSTACQNSCGGNPRLQYPFGFSEGCGIRLNCSSNEEIKIGEFIVQNVTFSSILINLPAKCNRKMESMKSLIANNFAPTSNNSFLVQNCTPLVRSCNIPPNFLGDQIELNNCNNKSDNITCFTQPNKNSSFLTHKELEKISCQFLFTGIAVDKKKDSAVSLQFQAIELGWWLEGRCQCDDKANCTPVHLADGKSGYRCRCPEGYSGDGFSKGTGCRKGE